MSFTATLSKLGESVAYTFNTDFTDHGELVEHAGEGLTNPSLGAEDDPDEVLVEDSVGYLDAGGWNNFKNADVVGDDSEAVALYEYYLSEGYDDSVAYYMMVGELGTETVVLHNFVQVDADFADYIRDVDLNILNCKRANIETGSGDDSIFISVLSNSDSWDNDFYIETGAGADVIVFDFGDADDAENDEFDYVNDGSLSTVYIDLGDDNAVDSLQISTLQDFDLTNFDLKTDKIDVQGAALESIVANVATFSVGTDTFTITADVTTFEGYFFDGLA